MVQYSPLRYLTFFIFQQQEIQFEIETLWAKNPSRKKAQARGFHKPAEDSC